MTSSLNKSSKKKNKDEKSTMEWIVSTKEANANALKSIRTELRNIRNTLAENEFGPPSLSNDGPLEQKKQDLEDIEELLCAADQKIKEAADHYDSIF